MPAGLGLIAAVGLAAAEVATYWDDSWHTDRGRDEFAIPPHLLLYGGVLAASLAVATWAVLAWRAAGWRISGIRTALRDPAIRLAGIGGFVTLASAPLDNWWHSAFGRDAVLWSPPHLTAVAGMVALVVGISAGLRDTKGRGAATARLFAGAGIIGALQVLVLEYDSDVPQFSTVWFLPVATMALCVAFALLDDLLPGRWAPTQAAAVYTLLRVATIALLATLGFSLTVLPPVFPLLLILGALARLSLSVRLVLLGGLSPLIWWPFLELQSSVTTTVPLAQLPIAVVLGIAGGALVAFVHGDIGRGRFQTAVMRGALVLVALSLMVGTTSGTAWAHDPGQGNQVEQVQMSVARSGDTANLRLVIPASCEGFQPVRVAARRAGQTESGDLRIVEGPNDDCVATGSVNGLTRGLWFVYAELKSSQGAALEAWLPVDDEASPSETRPLYEASARQSSASQTTVGAALFVVVLGIMVLTLRLSRQVSAVP